MIKLLTIPFNTNYSSLVKRFNRELAIVKCSDGLYHYIGAIEELELAEIGWKGSSNYMYMCDKRDEFGYKEFKANGAIQ